MGIKGKRSVDSFHRELGKIMWEQCGMERNAEGLNKALKDIPALRAEFYENVNVTGEGGNVNMELEKAGRVADFLEFGETFARDALTREESCGGHFRAEYQTPEGEAVRNDEDFCHAAVWEYQGMNKEPIRHTENMEFENVKLATRSYK